MQSRFVQSVRFPKKIIKPLICLYEELMIRKLFLFLIIIIIAGCGKEEKIELTSLKTSAALKANRAQFKNDLIDYTIKRNLTSPLDSSGYKKWESAFWAMGLARFESGETFNAVSSAMENAEVFPAGFRRSLLEAAFTFYPVVFNEPVHSIALTAADPKIFAMAVNYLTAFKNDPAENQKYLELMKTIFWNRLDDPIIFMLSSYLTTPQSEAVKLRPPLTGLLKHPLFGKMIVYSFFRTDRSYPGLTVIKKPDGEFLRDEKGGIFSVEHLALSSSNLPGYLTNGNTPQGIFSIQSIGSSENKFIGPTPTIITSLPYEIGVAEYFHGEYKERDTWDIGKYKKMLPESWKEYFPVYEAFYAGKAGRTEIIAHGTTIDPSFYEEMPYHPNSPSLGCITALELWDDETGVCLYSDQAKLVNAIRSLGTESGYWIVVNLDNKKMPVTLNELITEIITAEK